MRGSFILATTLASSIFFTGCAFNTVSNTTIKKENQKSIMPPMVMATPAPKKEAEKSEKRIKKIVKDSGVPQYGPNIYKSASSGPCGSNGCAKTKYDITQDGTTDYPVSYRPKRETIVKDIVLIQE